MNSRTVSHRPMPTNEGRHRYPHTAGYFPDLSSAALEPDTSLPCSCIVLCAPRCAGECGCLACKLQFVMWADESGYMGHERPLFTEDEQLRFYRGEQCRQEKNRGRGEAEENGQGQ